MNKILYKLFVSILIAVGMFSYTTNAIEFITKDYVSVTQEQDSDVIIAGGEVNIENTLKQDAIIAGGEVYIKEKILQDLMFAAGEVTIKSEIKDDIRGIAGQVEIEENVNGDVILATGDLKINKGVTINGDLIVAAGKIVIDGNVNGKVIAAGGILDLNGIIGGDAKLYIDKFRTSNTGASINGNLIYNSESKIETLESISKGEITFTEGIGKKQLEKDIEGTFYSYMIIKILFIFIFSTVLFYAFQNLFKRTGKILVEKTGKSFLYGFLTFILVPIIAIIFFISVIGIPIGFLLIFWFILLIVFLEVINVTVITSLIVNKWPKLDNHYAKIGFLFLLSVIMAFLNGIDLIIGFFTIGALFLLKKELIEQFRNMK